ncbi:MAG TPA: hypothetical protein VFD65_03575 [Chitinophagales bacterium]|nr:hypothetical protein [Chitinophagales bacterium]
MNDIAQKIINLDKETISLREKYEEALRKKKFEGLDKVQQLEKELQQQYMEEGEKAYREIVGGVTGSLNLTSKVEVECISNKVNIDVVYNEIKEDLTERLWGKILSMEE